MQHNTEQLEYWNGAGGERWARQREQIDRAIGVFGAHALEQLAPQAGENVIDVGCGAGTATMDLAELVGPSGRVLGLDVSEQLLELARQRARHLSWIDWLQGDASSQDWSRKFDAMFSRFGVMFFEQPELAFRNLRRALRPGGCLSFVCWQAAEENPWYFEPLRCILPHLPEDPVERAANAPGPFGFADPEFVEETLQAAGFGEIEIRELRSAVQLGAGGVAGALEFCMQVGPAARLTADLPQAARDAISSSLTQLFQGALSNQVVTLPGATWIVSARN